MILIAGYPYIREVFLNTFRDLYDEVIFLLPKRWEAKKGAVVFKPPQNKNVVTTRAFFNHSDYPIIGGLFKGWMPFFPFILHKLKEVRVVYTPMEPILLSTLYQAVFSKLFGKKHFLFTWENVNYEKYSGFNGLIKNLILRMNLALCDGIICGNNKAKNIIQNYTRKPVAVMPLSGIDTEFFKPKNVQSEFRKNHNISDTKFVFSFIGALGYRKGVHLILKALRSLDHKNTHLIIVGSGEYKKDLQDQIAELDLSNVLMIPWADSSAVRDILAATDAFLYPSIPHAGWEEQFGYSIAEAMAMEVPVISTNSGSISDLIISGENGILIPPNDIGELQKAMSKLLNDSALRDKYARAGRQYIVDHFSYSEIAQKYAKFLHGV